MRSFQIRTKLFVSMKKGDCTFDNTIICVMKKITLLLSLTILLAACQSKKSGVPTVAFMDAFQDNTIAKAKQGFFDALAANGFDEKKGTLNVIYRNAQGDIPTLTQIAKYMISQQPTLIAACPTLATIAALQNTKTYPYS